jgi:hypothetical protein
MSGENRLEPYLLDWSTKFHTIFTLIDPAMNTSEIKLLHLALPKIKGQVRPPRRSDAGDETGQRRIARKSKVEDEDEDPGAAPHGRRDRIPLRKDETAAVTTQPAGPAPLPGNEQATQALIRNPDFWLLPMPAQATIRFLFTVDASSGPPIFRMMSEADQKMLLSGRMNSETPEHGITFYIGNEVGGQILTNLQEGNVFAGIADAKGERESCAAVFLADPPGHFVYLIPALKKIEGVSQMMKVPLKETSTLVRKAQESPPSREVIQLKRRPVIDPGSYPGRFTIPTASNMILYHDSNAKRDLCTLELQPAGFYTLETNYPMSPLQGFLAAILACIPW